MSKPTPTLTAAAIGIFAASQLAQAVPVPLGTATGTIAVHYNTGSPETPANQAYYRGQFSSSNPNGATFQFDDTDLSPAPGVQSWNSIFSGQPVGQSQFGLAFVKEASTDNNTVSIPSLSAYDNVNNSLSGRASAGLADWTVGDYKDGAGGASNPSNGDINSLLRGGSGNGNSITLTFLNVTPITGGFTVDVQGTLLSDGFIHWYNPALGNTDLTSWNLQDYVSFSGTLTYLTAEDTTPGVDYYTGTVNFYAHVPDAGGTLALLGLGLAGLGWISRRRA